MSMANAWVRLNCWIQCWRPVTMAAFYIMSVDQNSAGSVHIQSHPDFLGPSEWSILSARV